MTLQKEDSTIIWAFNQCLTSFPNILEKKEVREQVLNLNKEEKLNY